MKKNRSRLGNIKKSCAVCQHVINGFNRICLARPGVFSEDKADGCGMFKPNGKK